MTDRRKSLFVRRWRAILSGGLAWLALGIFAPRLAWTANPVDATVTVTPVADVSLTLSTDTYDFGTQLINTSTNSAVGVTLTNNGQVNVTVSKQITVQSNPVGWTAGTTASTDTYVLYCATATTRPSLSDFLTSGVSVFGAQGNVTNLAGPLGVQPVLTTFGAGSNVPLWFRLDMPTALSSGQSRSITIQFTGTAQ